jgi:hypothetical protein
MSKPRQVRIQLTGGIGDLEAWAEDLHAIAEEKGFVQHFQDGPRRFGDHGPIHRLLLGYIQNP